MSKVWSTSCFMRAWCVSKFKIRVLRVVLKVCGVECVGKNMRQSVQSVDANTVDRNMYAQRTAYSARVG